MVKNIIVSVCLLIGGLSATAQTQKEALVKKMTADVCDDLSKKDFSGKTKEELQFEVGMSFLPVLTKYEKELKEVYGEIGTEGLMEKIGEELGMRLVVDCPAFVKAIAENKDVMQSGATRKSTKANKSTINATLLKVVSGEFSHVLVKDANGKQIKIWWMEYFDGADELASNPQTMVNKKFSVTYTEKEVYSAQMKDYIKIKVLTSIE